CELSVTTLSLVFMLHKLMQTERETEDRCSRGMEERKQWGDNASRLMAFPVMCRLQAVCHRFMQKQQCSCYKNVEI
uniref:Uncharacterized protein n=1 Tax=Dicentrarchus labrax TaxID=13489 RepID=A0A8C4HA76_DICLA